MTFTQDRYARSLLAPVQEQPGGQADTQYNAAHSNRQAALEGQKDAQDNGSPRDGLAVASER